MNRKKSKKEKIAEAKCKMINNNYVLDIPDYEYDVLPCVSVVTITKNRKRIFELPIYNWENFIYPNDKIEWVIVDNSLDEDLDDILPNDKRINYIKSDNFNTIGDKRNFAVSECKYEYIVNMDDDDFYFPDSIIAKIKTMLFYKKDCVYSASIGIFNLKTQTSQIVSTYKKSFPEATMAFTKNFWKLFKFCSISEDRSEGKGMINKRYKKIITIPFWFNCIVFNHNSNITGKLRDVYDKSHHKYANLYDVFNNETKEIISNISKIYGL